MATDPQHAPAYMAHAMLSFNEQIERIGEVVAVIVVGMLLWSVEWGRAVAVRRLAAARDPSGLRPVGLARSQTSRSQRALIGWFGIRGIGSLFYLTYAIDHGLAGDAAATGRARAVGVVVSILVHGISVTPLMNLYERRKPAARKAA